MRFVDLTHRFLRAWEYWVPPVLAMLAIVSVFVLLSHNQDLVRQAQIDRAHYHTVKEVESKIQTLSSQVESLSDRVQENSAKVDANSRQMQANGAGARDRP